MKEKWTETTLGAQTDLLAGYPFKSANYTASEDSIRLLRGDNIVPGSLRWDDAKGWPAADVAPYGRYHLCKGDVVLAMDRPWVKAGLKHAVISGSDLPCLLVQRTARLRSGPHLDQRFLLYLLGRPEFTRHILGIQTGLGVPHISAQQIQAFRFYLPPLREQRRLVAVLDNAFEDISSAQASADRNIQNARALFDSSLHALLANSGEGWGETTLAEACSIARGGSPRPIKKYLTTAADGINWVKIGDATAGGKYVYKTEEKIIPAGAKRSRVVRPGDFLLSNSMSFGRPYIMQTTGCVHDGWLVLSDYASCLDQDYLYHVLGSPIAFRQFDRLAAGSTVRNLNIELTGRVVIPVPPLEAQRKIAQDLDRLFIESQRLASVYERKQVALEELKRSLLYQAFTGQLSGGV